MFLHGSMRKWGFALGLTISMAALTALLVGLTLDGSDAQAAKSLGKCGGFVIHQTAGFDEGAASGTASPPFAGTVVILDGTTTFDAPGGVPHLILGSDLDDTIAGSTGDDLICGNGGNDDLTGDDGDDVLNGGAGCDHIDGDAGDDQLVGGPGNDTSAANGGCDGTGVGGVGSPGRLEGQEGDDVLQGGPGFDTCVNDDAVDILEGCDEIPPPS